MTQPDTPPTPQALINTALDKLAALTNDLRNGDPLARHGYDDVATWTTTSPGHASAFVAAAGYALLAAEQIITAHSGDITGEGLTDAAVAVARERFNR